ncbi:MAG: hypothetical protein M3Q70_03645 [bacterium]|nr:hypothetical protein [bacterium]
MALFGRRTTTTDIPELQEYYAAKRANNSAGAWVLALISLIITVLLILGLFFGGRWLWRKVRGGEDRVVTTTQEASDQIEEGIESDTGVDTDNVAPDSTDNAADTNSTNNTTTPATNGTSTQPQTGQTGSTGASTTTPNTDEEIAAARASGNLPNSGPGDVVGIFVATTAAGYVVHRQRQLKRQ